MKKQNQYFHNEKEYQVYDVSQEKHFNRLILVEPHANNYLVLSERRYDGKSKFKP